ncbi:alpha/beta hydrolase [Clostridium sp. cel8]|jgi:uncharacterized protein|uniref:alpha/beta hydrolase n=1 Tax=unclassified Clostridium TaxID=2614128 RepID=UPI0015F5CE17|nr:alpha/beta hydrolase [Clostridium sp. cel8]MBA5851503.1 alpha/beta hydrolase [Clostridium sp. cel8]
MQKSVEIQSRGLTLRGMMHVPDNMKNKISMVCMFHGFTGNKAEKHFIFVKLSRMLEKIGIGSVRFDFSGSGESDGEFVDMTILTELQEAKDILNYVKGLEFVDNNNIGVLGLSMGGAVSSILAGDCKESVKALCLWAPAGNMGEIVKNFETDKNVDTIQNKGFLDIGGFCVGIDFVKALNGLDIFNRSSVYDKNVLLIHGNLDETVPFKTSERYLDIYGENAFLHPIEGSDHTFNRKDWEDEVLDCTSEFFRTELIDK